MQFLVQLLYTDDSGSWHCTVHSYWYSCCTQMSVGHGTARYIVSDTAVLHRCQWVLALYSMQFLVQLLYTDVSVSWHFMVCSFCYSCCTQMSVGHGTARYIVSGTDVVRRCQWVTALHGT
jgi:hypothetical protein